MNNLIEFFKRYFHLMLFVFLQIIAIVMIYNTLNYPRFAISTMTQSFTAPINEMCNNVIRYFNLSDENEYLVQQNLNLVRQQKANLLFHEDTIVTAELVVTDSLNHRTCTRLYDYSYANVVYNTVHKRNNYLMIDKGAKDGMTYDMAVISAQGVVGVISDVSSHFSTVISVLNPDSRISAKVVPANQLGTIVWKYGDPSIVYLEDIPEYMNINVGDSVVTSGYSNIFPSDVLIGTICEKAKAQTNSFLTLKVKLATNFNHINTVYVIENIYKNELDSLKNRMKNE
ncbi:MAG: rod shape-determining protein MreC [Bacteroidales bacterium]|nr:rod shape-determining protein MreC [Bacteroidales bacterium]